LVDGRDTDEGYEITGRISDTARGNDVRTMLRDGTLDRLSVGFVPVEHTVDEETGTVTRTKVDLKEISVVPFPAYDGAKVSEVRADSTNANTLNDEEVSNETTMEIENTYDDTEIRAQVENLTRELAVVRENGVQTSAVAGSEFRSAGEWGVAYIQGDARAKAELERAETLVTSTAGHNANDWRGGLLTVVNNGRPLVNMFDSGTVAKGHKTVEFLKALTVSGNVAVQSSEGATIANMSGTVTTDTATLQTYAGYIDVSFQTIDWTDVDLVDGLLRAAAGSYAKVTNDAFRTALTGATPQTGAAFTLSSATAGDFIDTITDAAQKIYNNATLARTVDFAVASTDVFNAMAGLVDDDGRPLFGIAGQSVNSIGNANPVNLTLSVAGLPVVWDGGLSSKTLYVASKGAVGSWENAGAPLALQDVNITALTKQYALYGYFVAKAKDANGLVKANIS
jgi:HK97 family phage major capsid protein